MGGKLAIRDNAALTTLALPSLWGGGAVSISGSPLLPTCEASAVPAAYRFISGTDAAATCP